jgi:ribonuclease D
MTDTISPPVWVNTNQLMKAMLSDVEVNSRIAVDTESNSLHAYRERVCLIQISTPRADYVIDPLALTDIISLAPIFKNPQVEKIFHAAEYDLICLRRDFGFEFSTIFDTMQAARILGYSFVGLDNLLAEKFQVHMDKRHQKADWAARPLSPAQIDYARLDTHYLFGLRDLLENELRERGRLELAYEDFARQSRPEEPKEKPNGSTWKRFSTRKDVSLRELTILAELCHQRDVIAEKLDRPPFKVIDDNLLLAIARSEPEQVIDLAAIGLSPRQIRLWGGDMLAAFKRGVEAPLLKREQPKRPDDATLKRLEKLKNWRKKIAQELNVESDIVLPKSYMNLFAENPPMSILDLEKTMADSPWRIRTYGSQILSLVGG